jgi:cold shock CspA family protein
LTHADLTDVVARGTRVVRYGRVTAYDEGRGLGSVETRGGAWFAFHSTAIANGSRRIAVGSRVSFVVVAGVGGRFEAASLSELESHDGLT